MSKIAQIIFFAVSSSENADGDYFMVTNGGNVGIGSTSPLLGLEIVNKAADFYTGYDASLLIKNSTYNQEPRIVLYNSSGASLGTPTGELYFASNSNYQTFGSGVRGYSASSLGSATGLQFFTTGTAQTRLTINETGLVGIGTTSPTSLLHVSDNSGTWLSSEYRSANLLVNRSFSTASSDVTSYGQYINNTSSRATGANNLTNIGLYVNVQGAQSNYAAIFNGGNVGIGTTSPRGNLDIGGDNAELHIGTAAKGYIGLGTQADYSANWTNQAAIAINTVVLEGTGSNGLNIRNHTDGAWGSVFASTYTTYGGSLTTPSFGSSNQQVGMYFPGSTGVGLVTSQLERLTVNSVGNVGIGTTTPVGKLNVEGAVTGKALAIFNETGNQDILTASASGSTKFAVTNGGNILLRGTSPSIDTGNLATLTFSVANANRVQIDGAYLETNFLRSHSGAGTSLIVRGNNLQTANIFEVEDSNGTDFFTIDTSGNVGIGSTTPGQKLDVVGNARFSAVGSDAYASDLHLTADGTLTTAASDIRLKKDFVELNDSATLDKILQLKTYNFNWKSNNSADIGMVAQEVATIFPELTFTNQVDGYMGINYSRFSSLLISGMQAQQAQISLLQNALTFNSDGSVVVATTSAQENNSEENTAQQLLGSYASLSENIWKFLVEVRFSALAVFENSVQFLSAVVFKNDVIVDGNLILNHNQAGTVTIPTGKAGARVTFSQAFEQMPIITLTSTQKVAGEYWISQTSNSGFTIEFSQAQTQDIAINWQVSVTNSGEGVAVEAFDFGTNSEQAQETQDVSQTNPEPITEDLAEVVEEATQESAILGATDSGEVVAE